MGTRGPKSKINERHVYELYKTYEASYSRTTPYAKTQAIEKVQSITNISRATVYKILKSVREKNNLKLSQKACSRKKWVTGVDDKKAKAIESKILHLSELNKLNNGHVSIRRIHKELIKDQLFKGSKGSLYTLLQQLGFSYLYRGTGWELISKKKTPIDEQLNLNRKRIANISISNMMEVKQSPAAQMDFRSTSNGLPDEEDEDLDTLFDGGVGKNLKQPIDECDATAPVLNGISKHVKVKTTSGNISKVKLENSNDSKVGAKNTKVEEENEEEEETQAVLGGLDLDLDEESAGKMKNGEITNTPKVRDTGDDLDTLLSKINDLVEDCMDPNKDEDDGEIVEIADDEWDEIEYDVTDKTEDKSGILREAILKPETELSDTKENNAAATVSEEAEGGKMDVNEKMIEYCDDIVCLDSPEMDKDSETVIEEALRTALETDEEKQVEEEVPEKLKEQEKEEDITEKDNETVEKPESEEPKSMEDDDIFFIEDDDDDEPMKEAESSPKSVEKLNETDLGKNFVKEIEAKIERSFKETSIPTQEEQKTEMITADNPPMSNHENEEDDEIVCLDDSIEETEEKENEPQAEPSMSVLEESTKEGKDSEEVEKSVNETEKEKEPEKKEKEEEDVEKSLEKTEEEVSKEDAAEDKSKLESKGIPSDNKTEPEKASNVDLDVVILDDDDDEDEGTSTSLTDKKCEKSLTKDLNKESPPSSSGEDKQIEDKLSEETTAVKSSAILSDNSDNARDGVEEKEIENETKACEEKTPVPSENNSCSNSSNLLKETTNKARKDNEENREQPPSKRPRLSQDEASSRHSIISQDDSKSNTVEDDEVMLVKIKEDEDNTSLKRVHSTDSVSLDAKKIKTDEESVKVNKVEPPVDLKEKVEVKPLPLYPPPKLETPTIDLSLDFLRRFKKSIHKMTKSDLEELVLQKIVEAIVHKSEFSEMRELIEKQEKIIATHRTKITDLNKQFRDLEMVHNRVLKDLETKNSQFIMPVKITRAVGLQVYFPNKKYDQPLLPLSPNTMQTPPASITKSTNNITNSAPERSSFSSPVTPSGNSMTPTSSNPAAAVNNATKPQAAGQRRCVLKVTPLRPDTQRNPPLNRSATTGAVSSSTPSPSATKEPAPSMKILNRSLAQKSRLNSPANVTAAVQPDTVTKPQADKYKTSAIPPIIAPKISILQKEANSSNYAMQTSFNKSVPKVCQSDPHSVAQPLPAEATIVSPMLPVVSGNASVTSKPPSKSVIDLTDEDDVATTGHNSSSKTPAAAAQKAAATTQSATPIANRGPYKVSVVPQQQLQQQPKPNPPKQTPQRPVGVPIAPKPNGVTIAVRQLPSNPTRYRHPAPLPNQPIHSSNPSWKLPPARPTIRISNLESGIVISWTIEDTAKDKYAESTSYQIYAYQETSGPPLVESWRHVGDVKAMLLPMAVTLTQFQEGQRYYFAVRAVDAHNRCGPFSFAKTWS